MRLGIIDLGTNSVRFDIHELHPERDPRILYREKFMIRLGQGVFTEGKLDQNAVERASHAFTSFKKLSDELHVNKVIAFGTSALRDSSDADTFVKLIAKKNGNSNQSHQWR